MTKNIPYLDGWRGLAILAVLVGHFAGPGQTRWLGSFGVALFFALSGFLMSRLLFIKRVNLKDFFVRRFNRVIPTFVLFVFAMVLYAGSMQPARYQVPATELMATLTFLRAYVPSGLDLFADLWPTGHLWSLGVEEHSYVLLALMAFVTRRAQNTWATGLLLVAGAGLALGFNVAYLNHPPDGASPWAVRSECAAFGLLVAAAMRYLRFAAPVSWLNVAPAWLPVLSFVLAVACFSSYAYKSGANLAGAFCLAYCVNYIDRVPVFFTRVLSLAPLRWFGVCSFSLYLWQQPFYLAVHYHGASKWWACGLAILAGALSYYAFEQVTRLRLNRAWGANYDRTHV